MAYKSFDTSWRINKYRNNYDSHEVWELKRAFMQKYINSVPEDELAKLTQIMVNVELLKCTYPIELMNRVENMAASLLKKFRAKRQNRTAERTVVSASVAAVGYVQRHRKREEEQDNNIKKPIDFVPEKRPRIDPFVGEFGRIILYETDSGGPLGVLQMIPIHCKVPMKENKIKINDQHQTDILLNGLLVASGCGVTVALANQAAREMAVARLKRIYYTLKVKMAVLSKGVIKPEEKDEGEQSALTKEQQGSKMLGENSFGFRLLQSLGWKPGEGIVPGAIVAPIEAARSRTMGRSGLGCTEESTRLDFKAILKDYAVNGGFYDLVFDKDFDKEERAKIHKIALELNLKSKSRDTGDERYLVISRKLNLFNLAQLMLSSAEKDEALLQKYELIPPSGE